MPIKNTVKIYASPAYYHVYNRGAGGQPIFIDDMDRRKFLSLIARHLVDDVANRRTDGAPYPVYDLEVLAYCLMGNHFHFLIYQPNDSQALTKFMRSVSTAYTMYFNRKYKRSGHLFQSIFKAAHIFSDQYLLHISRYIHMNPRSYLNYPWSSLKYYLGEPAPEWLCPERVNDMQPKAYREFLADYEGKKAELERIKHQLADQH